MRSNTRSRFRGGSTRRKWTPSWSRRACFGRLTLDRGLIGAPSTLGPGPFFWGRFQAEATDSAANLAAKLAGWYTPFRDGYKRLTNHAHRNASVGVPALAGSPPIGRLKAGLQLHVPIMKITTTTFNRLLPRHLAAWEHWQREDPALASPYFHPEFVRLAASVRGNVEIAQMEEDGTLAGILPFARVGGIGLPVAVPTNDFQGVIARPGFTWDSEELVRGCGLAALRFDHILASQSSFAKYHYHVDPSPYLDLSQGFEAYEKERLAAGCVELGQAVQGPQDRKPGGPAAFCAAYRRRPSVPHDARLEAQALSADQSHGLVRRYPGSWNSWTRFASADSELLRRTFRTLCGRPPRGRTPGNALPEVLPRLVSHL